LAELIAAPDSATAAAALEPVLPARFGGRAPVFSPIPGFTLEGGEAPRF